jgi:hypothetical protein
VRRIVQWAALGSSDQSDSGAPKVVGPQGPST